LSITMMKVKDLKVCTAKSATSKSDMTLALTAAKKSKNVTNEEVMPAPTPCVNCREMVAYDEDHECERLAVMTSDWYKNKIQREVPLINLDQIRTLLEADEYVDLGNFAKEMKLGSKSISLLGSLVLLRINEDYPDSMEYEEIEEFLVNTEDLFHWSRELLSELAMRQLENFANAQMIEVFKSKDPEAECLFEYLIAEKYLSLQFLRDENLLDSWSVVFSPPYLDSYRDGLFAICPEHEDPSDYLEDLDTPIYIGGAQFSILNWRAWDATSRDNSCKSCEHEYASPLPFCGKEGCGQREFRFETGTDMDLRIYMDSGKSMIVAAGEWGKPNDSNYLISNSVPYIAGVFKHSGILGFSQFDWEGLGNDGIWDELDEGYDYKEITFDDLEPFVVIGWRNLTLDLFSVKEFKEIISGLKLGLQGKEVFQSFQETTHVSLLRGPSFSRFEDFCAHIIGGFSFFGRRNMVRNLDSKDASGLRMNPARLAEFSKDEDESLLELIATSPSTPEETLLELSENSSWAIRRLVNSNPRISKKVSERDQRELALQKRIDDRFVEIGIIGLTIDELVASTAQDCSIEDVISYAQYLGNSGQILLLPEKKLDANGEEMDLAVHSMYQDEWEKSLVSGFEN
jgi:hypothetical protein